MKNPLDIVNSIPKPVIEVFSFVISVLGGSVFKMRKMHEKGIKITFKRFLIEAFMSFFIAFIAYAFVDQYLHFNKIFTYALCSLAGSMSDKVYTKAEEYFLSFLPTKDND